MAVVGTQELRVEIGPLFPDRNPCTADIAPRTTHVEVPGDVFSDEPLTVHLRHENGDEQTVVVPPAEE